MLRSGVDAARRGRRTQARIIHLPCGRIKRSKRNFAYRQGNNQPRIPVDHLALSVQQHPYDCSVDNHGLARAYACRS